MVAGAAFAAPSFSLKGAAGADVFNFETNSDAETYEWNVLTAPGAAGTPKTSWKASVAGDRAGASITNDAGTTASFWFKPVDLLKVTLDGAYNFSVDLSPVTLDVKIPGSVVKGVKGGDPEFAMGQVVKVTYKADGFGTAYVQYTNTYNTEVNDKTHQKGIAAIEQYYENTFAPVTVKNKVNVDITKNLADSKKSDTAITEDLTLEAELEAAKVTFNNVYGIKLVAGEEKAEMSDSTSLSVEVPVSDMTATVAVSEADWFTLKDSEFAASATLSGKYDVLGWSAGLTCTVNGNRDDKGNLNFHGVKIAVPFGFSVAF